ncbi:tc5 transposase DNA-binding domain-containing protein [Hirsutella rhossiliensis]|uniref:Tc5 transposase DNA-binding domain-containing protein n=1 Tax=Hirsutella rhossiliensis TaxID=111463 RepID=A0A9P8SDJ0_9HYPO|nr:tc5 transposase DNA-binding domain-containing protein [Hirsutella rhossiliensis]KAH0957066.1 tc5 transposase DNA-binding domain-containing protein [Hirsutella rhossiliensis]
MASSKAKESAVQKWIDSATGLPSFSRHTTANLETRTIAGAELYYEGFYGSIVAAAKALGVPYKRLYYRVNGHHSTAENGGNRALLDPSDEEEVFCWAHRRITQGHHIQGRALQQHANAILKAKGVGATASRAWAKRFIQRHRELFHRRRAAARDIKRKAMQDRIHKARKADKTLALNGITATAEMTKIKEKQAKRSSLQQQTTIVARYGPLSVGDARIRVARDEYNRQAAQEEEAQRVRNKEVRDEAGYIRRWLQGTLQRQD